MKKIKLFLMLIGAAFIVSCTSTTYQEISIPATNPTYATNVEPVIKANCVGCHGGSQSPSLKTYEEVKNATQNGSLICRIDQTQACGSVMPPSGALSKETISMILLWQKQGYSN